MLEWLVALTCAAFMVKRMLGIERCVDDVWVGRFGCIGRYMTG